MSNTEVDTPLLVGSGLLLTNHPTVNEDGRVVVEILVSARGGTGQPYDYAVEWGDGTRTDAGLLDASDVMFEHEYQPPPPYTATRRMPKRGWWDFRKRYETYTVTPSLIGRGFEPTATVSQKF